MSLKPRKDPNYGSADPQRSASVLFVTEDPDLRAAGARALERHGYRVIPAAHSGHALLACIAEEHIDAVVADLSMSHGSGPALTERVRRHHPNAAAIYFGHPGTRDCDSVIVRPFTRDELLARLEAALAALA